MAELDEWPYEWACSRTAGFVLFHTLGCLGTQLVTICAGYSCFQGLMWVLRIIRTQRCGGQLLAKGEDAYTAITFPKDPLQRGVFLWVSSLASEVLLQAEISNAPAKAQSWEKKPSFFNVKLMKKHRRCCPRWIGTKCNVITCTDMYRQWGKKKRRNMSLRWKPGKGSSLKFVFSYPILGFEYISSWKVGSSS